MIGGRPAAVLQAGQGAFHQLVGQSRRQRPGKRQQSPATADHHVPNRVLSGM
jgi:hypothetical protein